MNLIILPAVECEENYVKFAFRSYIVYYKLEKLFYIFTLKFFQMDVGRAYQGVPTQFPEAIISDSRFLDYPFSRINFPKFFYLRKRQHKISRIKRLGNWIMFGKIDNNRKI